jgi:hypothetical protein
MNTTVKNKPMDSLSETNLNLEQEIERLEIDKDENEPTHYDEIETNNKLSQSPGNL